jgi:hypothetical protein
MNSPNAKAGRAAHEAKVTGAQSSGPINCCSTDRTLLMFEDESPLALRTIEKAVTGRSICALLPPKPGYGYLHPWAAPVRADGHRK